MKYSFTCAPDGKVLSTAAKNDDEALTKLLKISADHWKQYHAGQPAMSEAEATKLIRSVWKKE